MTKIDKAPRGVQRMAFDASAIAQYAERERILKEQKQLNRLKPKELAVSVSAYCKSMENTVKQHE